MVPPTDGNSSVGADGGCRPDAGQTPAGLCAQTGEASWGLRPGGPHGENGKPAKAAAGEAGEAEKPGEEGALEGEAVRCSAHRRGLRAAH